MLEVVLSMLEVVNGVRCVLRVMLCMLVGMRRVPFCMLEVAGELCLPEVMCCVLLCILEAVEAGLCFVGGAAGDALCATLHAGRGGDAGRARGDALCATLLAGGVGGAGDAGGNALRTALYAGGDGGDALCAALYARGRGG